VITRAVAAGMPVGVHAPNGGAQAARYAEQGATIVTAAVDAGVLVAAVQEQLSLVRGSHDRAGGS